MLDITQFLIGSAMAQTPSVPLAPPGGAGTSTLLNFLPLFLIFGVFYFLLIRPQQKKLEEQGRMLKALKRGDRIITAGGIHGKIAKLEGDEHLIVEIADGVQVKVVRATVSSLAAKTEPAVSANEDLEKKN